MKTEKVPVIVIEDLISFTKKNLNEKIKWIKSEINLNGNSMLDDLKQAYHLDKWSTVNLQRANDYLKIEEVFLSSEVSNTLLQLCNKLKKFREDLLKKQKQVEETILFYINEGLSLSGKDFINEEAAAEELKAFSGDDEDILTPQFRECECKE